MAKSKIADIYNNAVIKLTIRFCIVLFFVLYAISYFAYSITANVLDSTIQRDLRNTSQRLNPYRDQEIMQGILELRQAQIQEEKDLILNRLTKLNFVIMIGGGFACYIFARRILRPLEQNHQSHKRFAADVSHELKTPLAIIKLENEIALESDSVPKLKEVLQNNIHEVDRIVNFANRLLAVASVYEGSIALSDIRLDAIIKKVFTKNDDLVIHVEGGRNYISVEPDLFAQVFEILKNNSLKFKNKNELLSIDISLRVVEKGCIITYCDNGIGLPKNANTNNIIDRFKKRSGNDKTTNKRSGFGIGLSLAEYIISLHKGRLEIINQPNQVGFKSCIKIPLK